MSWKAFLSRNLQSVKFMACPTAPSSEGVRSFWINNYNEIKHLNPRFPFMLRANPDADPYVLIEYGASDAAAWPPRFPYPSPTLFRCADYALKEKIMLPNLTAEQVEDRIRQAVIAGEEKPRSYWQSKAPLRLPTVVE